MTSNIVGESYNTEDKQDVVAITYGIASDGGHSLQDLNGYRHPTMVEKLPDIVTPPTPGPLESVDEVASATTYYDGSLHLNVAQIDCHIINVPGDCVKQTVCGWCGQTSSCVRGTALAPVEPCQRNSYMFSSPQPNW